MFKRPSPILTVLFLVSFFLAGPGIAEDSWNEAPILESWQTSYELAPRIGGLALDTLEKSGEALSLDLEEIDDSGALHSRVYVGTVRGETDGWSLLAVHRSAPVLSGIVISSRFGYLRVDGRSEAGRSTGELTVHRLAAPVEWAEAFSARSPSRAPSKGFSDEAVTVVDVLIAYTDRALQAMGGTASLQNRLDAQVAFTNQVYANSGVSSLQLKLVFAGYVKYNEGANGDRSKALRALREPNDGEMDEVHDWREYYGADLVSLQATVLAGYATTSLNDAFAFSVVPPSAYEGFSFAHEAGGHNLNCRHDRFNYWGDIGAESKNHGWSSCYIDYYHCIDGCGGSSACLKICLDRFFDCEPDWATVMSVTGTASSLRIPYFSNPNLTYKGDPLGDARANNAENLRSAGPTVASHRPRRAVVRELTISPGGGFYPHAVDVTIRFATPIIGFDTIHYTTDGSEPTKSSPIYAGPIRLTSSATVKAVSFAGNQPTSMVEVASFTLISSTEVCDGLDNDLDGATDEGNVCLCSPHTYQGATYEFCNRHVSWPRARAACQAMGQDLVIVNDAAENQWIADTSGSTSRWLGLSDVAVEGQWRWVNNVAATYTNWSAQEPNGGENENCGMSWILGQPDDGTWNDLNCSWTNAFVCE